MYKDYYRLKTEPFSTHPSTSTFFISNTHKEAWYYLLFGIDTQEPFLVLTGEYGMGKTLLCLRLIKVLKEKGTPRVEYIPTSNEGFGGILRRMATSLGISPVPEDEEILQDMIYDRFRADTENSRFYLIIDDAHELDTTILTKLKYLSTFNHNEFFPVIMIFVGHPSFLQDLRTPALSSLNQRIKRRYHLARFSLEDTKDYIYFRLLKSGATGVPAFPDETIKKIFEYSGGVPRLINNICDTCLLIGASKQLTSIPPTVVDEAKNLVEGSLLGTKEDAKTASVVTEEAKNAITFSEDLPAAANASRQEAPPEATDSGSSPVETGPPEKIPPVRKSRYGLKLAIVAIVLVLGSVVLFELFIDEDSKIWTLFSQKAMTLPFNPPGEPEKTTVPPPAADKSAVEVPALREELTEKPSLETTPAGRGEGVTPAPADLPLKQSGGTETRAASKIESPSPGAGASSAVHPFSLKLSSYQQLELAIKEVAEIRQLGLTAYPVKVEVGDLGILWRVYIGFYSTEEEARRAKSTYKLANATIQKTDYACQVGDFSNETDSLNMFERLKQLGYFPYAIQQERGHFRLYLGAYEKKSEAESLRQELQKKGINNQVVKR